MIPTFAAIVTVAVVVLTPSVTAVGCFSGGQAGDCSAAIGGICAQVNGFTFAQGQTISTCVDTNGFRCNMAVTNTGGGGSQIGQQECIDDMTATNNGCNGHGGIRADGNFQLTLDPNTGAC
ncbi:hypothetical protein B0H16DRAFT_1538676 [Mycena metata]|uniref:Glycan binding protein Y3-like domain-containing protein n=2 Tax=Mycena TaxID=41247 RepID=A0AAD7J5K1_9AGAR|nr:hypothetical protein C8F04DRAFT_1288968 [Mycena alexandri]KAJ7744388.1 hypothetical protein B0H16DRAFT_1559999 [Mycena metata]KAJ7756672.1 hypothetical protein B0H16DRAFT_1538676 [Mycena metata]